MRFNLFPLPLLLVVSTSLSTGCTSVLWRDQTFACRYEPAEPANLRLFYSPARKDLLAVYDEARDTDDSIRPRRYWLGESNGYGKPPFVSSKSIHGLTPIPVDTGSTHACPASLRCAFDSEGDVLTLYAGDTEVGTYVLPRYDGSGELVIRVLLTPFAVAIDATIVGAVIGYASAPSLFESLSR